MPIKNSTEEEKRKLFSKAFTLVEMLIVVVLIWILSSAILPRLTSYMTKTRDLKRQADLRNIAAAIEMYRNTYGEFPNPQGTFDSQKPIARNIYRLTPYLENYLSSIPTDPQKNSLICIHWQCSYYKHTQGKTFDFGHKEKNTYQGISKGEYAYQLSYKDFNLWEHAFLIAKTETVDASNYVLSRPTETHKPGSAIGFRTDPSWTYFDPDYFYLCDSITKSNVARWTLQTNWTYKCTYTSEDQLYYILKIE